jgi:hypothetical protein
VKIEQRTGDIFRKEGRVEKEKGQSEKEMNSGQGTQKSKKE